MKKSAKKSAAKSSKKSKVVVRELGPKIKEIKKEKEETEEEDLEGLAEEEIERILIEREQQRELMLEAERQARGLHLSDLALHSGMVAPNRIVGLEESVADVSLDNEESEDLEDVYSVGSDIYGSGNDLYGGAQDAYEGGANDSYDVGGGERDSREDGAVGEIRSTERKSRDNRSGMNVQQNYHVRGKKDKKRTNW